MEDISKKEKKVSDSDTIIECSICHEKPQKPVFCATALDKHPVCRECAGKWAKMVDSNNFTCPLCRTLYDQAVRGLFYTDCQKNSIADFYPVIFDINNEYWGLDSANRNDLIRWLDETFPRNIQ